MLCWRSPGERRLSLVERETSDAYPIGIDHDNRSRVEIFGNGVQVRFQKTDKIYGAPLTLPAEQYERRRPGVRFGEQLTKIGVA